MRIYSEYAVCVHSEKEEIFITLNSRIRKFIESSRAYVVRLLFINKIHTNIYLFSINGAEQKERQRSYHISGGL